MSSKADMERYFSGEVLYGDDFSDAQIAAWYHDEEEAYACLNSGSRSGPCLPYLQALLFRHLPPRRFSRVLGLGSAEGAEFYPLRQRIDHITIIEPSASFVSASVFGIPCDYVKPSIDGAIQSKSTFDLATAFAVLHHIPNVSFVVRQLFEALKPGGILLVHEPIESMGDWRIRRCGLTAHERGVPAPLLRRFLCDAGFHISCCQYFSFPVTNRLISRAVRWKFGVGAAVFLDLAVSSALSPFSRYHPQRPWQKLRPRCVAFVAQRPE